MINISISTFQVSQMTLILTRQLYFFQYSGFLIMKSDSKTNA